MRESFKCLSSWSHFSLEVRIDHKYFLLETLDNPNLDVLKITECNRQRKFVLKFEIGCALWLSRCLYEAHYDSHVNKFFRMFRGSFYQVWVEKFSNSFGSFLRISHNESGFVRSILVPQGRKVEGWKILAEAVDKLSGGDSGRSVNKSAGHRRDNPEAWSNRLIKPEERKAFAFGEGNKYSEQLVHGVWTMESCCRVL